MDELARRNQQVSWEVVNATIAAVVMLIEEHREFRTREVVRILEEKGIVVTDKPETIINTG